mgnify:CR=1 FL=1
MNRMKGVAKHTSGSRRLGAEIYKHRMVYTLILPGLIWYLLFAYGPMSGLSLAFKTYRANLGIWQSPWVGMQNYRYVFRDAAFWRAVWRTLYINMGRLLFEFPMPVLLSLMLNELRVGRYKKMLQTVFTFPHFLSWIIVSSVLINFLSAEGLVNSLSKNLGGEAFNFLGNTSIFQPMLYVTAIWKGAGWSAIIYLAAISGIDIDQYEAAEIDGASRMQRIAHITLPNILPTVIVMFILQTGNLMSAGFDQIFNLYSHVVYEQADIIDTYVYRMGVQAGQYGMSTALGLAKSLVAFLLIITTNKIITKCGGEGVW